MFDWLTNLFGTTEEAWQSAVARFVNATKELDAAEQQHLSIRPIAEELGELEEWGNLQDRYLYTRQGIEEIAEKLRQGSQWFRSTFGMSALGFVPLVPIAVITASISAVVALVYALSSYNTNLQRKWDYINSRPDLTPEQAVQVLESDPVGIGLGGNVQGMVTWIVLGGVVLLIGAHALKGQKSI